MDTRTIRQPQVAVVEHIDLEQIGSGGIDGIILDFIEHYGSSIDVCVVGVSSRRESVGSWRVATVRGKAVRFLAVRQIDKTRPRRLPHSVRFAWSLFRSRGELPRVRHQVHRAETGVFLRLLGLDYSLFLHNDLPGLTGRHSDSMWRWLPRLYRALEHAAVMGAVSVGVFSEAGATRIAAYRDDVVALKTWYDPKMFHPGPRTDGTATLTILWVGRMESQKAPMLAVDAFAVLRETISARLVMVGSGSLFNDVVDHCRDLGLVDDVTFTGSLPKDLVAEQMRTADVFLLTSHYEGSPTVMVEAAASGLPIASTKEADTDAFLADGTFGKSAETRDAGLVARAVLEAHSLSTDREGISEAVADRSVDRGVERFARVALAGMSVEGFA